MGSGVVLMKHKGIYYRPMVYICSPYAGDIEHNIEMAKKYSRFAVEHDTIPITPHLLYPQFMDDGNENERRKAEMFNRVHLDRCDEIWVFGEKISSGMQKEINHARNRKKKIRYFNEECEEFDHEDC